MRKIWLKSIHCFSLSTGLLSLWSCSSNSKSANSSQNSGKVELSSWANFYSPGLTTESWTQSPTLESQESLNSQTTVNSDPLSAPSVQLKLDWQNKYLAKNPPVSCLHPLLSETKAADIDEDPCYLPESGMIYTLSNDKTFGTQTGKNSKGEACLVSAARQKSMSENRRFDTIMASYQSVFCQLAKLDKPVFLPEIGQKIELSKFLSEFGGILGTVSEFSLTRLQDFEKQFTFKTTLLFSNSAGKTWNFQWIISNFTTPENKKSKGSISGFITKEKSSAGSELTRYLSWNYVGNIVDNSLKFKSERRSSLYDSSLNWGIFDKDGKVDFNKNSDLFGNFILNGQPVAVTENFSADLNLWLTEFSPTDFSSRGTHWFSKVPNFEDPTNGFSWKQKIDKETQNMSGCLWEGTSRNLLSQAGNLSLRKAQILDLNLELWGFSHPNQFIPSEESQAQSLCEFTQKGSLGTDFFHEMECKQNSNGATKSRWFKPRITNAWSDEFYSNQFGELVTKQCFTKENKATKFEINTTLIPEAAGYSLVKASDERENLVNIKPDDIGTFGFPSIP